jgi:hypothetical protein
LRHGASIRNIKAKLVFFPAEDQGNTGIPRPENVVPSTVPGMEIIAVEVVGTEEGFAIRFAMNRKTELRESG